MRVLRTVSTRRLLAVMAGAIVAICGGTAIAVAATSGGPVPQPATLASALETALSSPAPAGISARVNFTDNLVSPTTLPQGMSNDPLLTGAVGRLWISGNEARLELQGSNGDAELLYDNGSFWAYDPSSNTVYKGTVPADWTSGGMPKAGWWAYPPKSSIQYSPDVPSTAQIQQRIDRLSKYANVSGATPTDIAGQPAYSVTISPKQSGGLLGSVQLGFDANHATPLSAAVFARGDSTPALQLAASSVSYGAVPASDFAIAPPPGAKVVTVTLPTAGAAPKGSNKSHAHRLQTSGSGLNTIAVLKHRAKGSGSAEQVISTELGTVIELTRGGFSYLIAGSVTPAAAEAVAKTL
jgi:outer membrane lipoprotein-sorting protein